MTPPRIRLRRFNRPAGFLVYVLSIPVGGAILALGLTRAQPLLAVAGGLGVVFFVALHVTRSRWGMKPLADEIARNPFNPKRVPKGPGEGIL